MPYGSVADAAIEPAPTKTLLRVARFVMWRSLEIPDGLAQQSYIAYHTRAGACKLHNIRLIASPVS